jgi:membrane protein implicated in regulation of membrane protease activity
MRIYNNTLQHLIILTAMNKELLAAAIFVLTLSAVGILGGAYCLDGGAVAAGILFALIGALLLLASKDFGPMTREQQLALRQHNSREAGRIQRYGAQYERQRQAAQLS